MIGQQKTVQTSTKSVSVKSQASQAFKTVEADMPTGWSPGIKMKGLISFDAKRLSELVEAC